jgi:hypothetical protein
MFCACEIWRKDLFAKREVVLFRAGVSGANGAPRAQAPAGGQGPPDQK